MPKKLLLADDSITIQKVIGITFANEDFELTTVDNGTDAIATARRIRPDLILADVVMPGKNGYEVCEYVKHDRELRGTPVLLLAGTFESFDEAEMARVGADGYITKPFESQTLIDKVHELTSRAQPDRGTAPTQRPAASAAADDFNLDDFSPFEEVSGAAAEPAAEAAPAEAERPGAGWDTQGDEDVWDLSDFEAEGGTPAAGAGLEPAAAQAPAAAVEGEQTFDFAEDAPVEEASSDFELEAAEEAFGAAGDETFAGGDPFGGNGDFAAPPPEEMEADDALELTDIEEVADDAFREEAPEEGAPAVAAAAAEGWEVAPVAQVHAARPAAPAPRAAASGPRLADRDLSAIASRVRAAAEGLAGELKGAGANLSAGQVQTIVERVAREVIEEVAWEVVPDLCEALITAEIRRLTGQPR